MQSSTSLNLTPPHQQECIVISDDSNSPKGSPAPKKVATVYDLFPQITMGQSNLLSSLFGDINEVVEILLEGVTASSLLTQFKLKKVTEPAKLITVRSNHIVQDGLRSLYKGKFSLFAPI